MTTLASAPPDGGADRVANPDTVADTLAGIQKLIVAKRFDDALDAASGLLAVEPANAEALYMRAVCERYLRRFDAALETIELLKRSAPELGRAHQEEGHCHRDSGRPGEALAAYARACQFNPALLASWRERRRILRTRGQPERAGDVEARLRHIERLPKPLLAVIDRLSEGKLLQAEDLCRQYLRKVPHDVEGMRLLADIGTRLGVLDDAEFLLESALRLDPENVAVRIDYIRTLRKRQKFAAALKEAEVLSAAAPDNPQFQSILAVEHMQTGNFDTAQGLFDQVLERLPGDPTTLTSKGHAHKTSGQYDAAVAAYHTAIDSNPNYGEAWYSLANLKVYEFDDDRIDTLARLEVDVNLPFRDRVFVNFALGKAWEDRGDFETSFAHYRKGNELKKAQSRYDADQMSADMAALRAVGDAALFAAREGSGCDARDPIFVVGLPRAGSTLLEQILSSHSMVDGTLELPNILSLAQRLRRAPRDDDGDGAYPQNIAELDSDTLQRFGREYIDDTRVHRESAPFFVDKMPNNFRYVGLIHLILPNAKIIDARRDPMACCFSGFRQLFAEGQEFSYDLGDIGRYYRDYVAHMDHWDRVLPGRVLRVQYEDVVADLETQVRRILDYCGLPFEASCVQFHRTQRSVRTPSSEQVRQPIFTSGLDYWRTYEPWLGPLMSALGDLAPADDGRGSGETL